MRGVSALFVGTKGRASLCVVCRCRPRQPVPVEGFVESIEQCNLDVGRSIFDVARMHHGQDDPGPPFIEAEMTFRLLEG